MTFAEKVYDATKRIPKGRVATYGQIAEIIGCPGGSRAVGNALHVNPFAPAVPCHRVVAANGSLAAHFGGGGPDVQYERLKPEGVAFLDDAEASKGSIPRVDLARCGIVIERHPLEPFLPDNAHILFLGSFPPPKARWSMEFFYPNWINDFWRIQGLIHFSDAHWFEGEQKRFDRRRIIDFCQSEGLAFYDTASKVCRWKGNASDEYLEILESADLGTMLSRMPNCQDIVTTGGKSSEELLDILTTAGATPQPAIPPVGSAICLNLSGRELRWWRMPSSSRAYPMPLQEKALQYSKLFR